MCIICTQERTYIKDPVVHVRVGWIMETWKHCTQGKKNRNWVAPYYDCSLSLGKAAWIPCALHWDKTIIESNLIYLIQLPGVDYHDRTTSHVSSVKASASWGDGYGKVYTLHVSYFVVLHMQTQNHCERYLLQAHKFRIEGKLWLRCKLLSTSSLLTSNSCMSWPRELTLTHDSTSYQRHKPQWVNQSAITKNINHMWNYDLFLFHHLLHSDPPSINQATRNVV